jgi:hypothetical protein
MGDREGESREARRARYAAFGALELAARIRDGDTLATEVLCARYAPILSRWAITHAPQDGTDPAQLRDSVCATIQNVLDARPQIEREGELLVSIRNAMRDRIQDLPNPRARREHDPASILETTIGHPASRKYEECLARLEALEREAIVCQLELHRGFNQLALDLAQKDAHAAHAIFEQAFVHLAEEMSDGL